MCFNIIQGSNFITIIANMNSFVRETYIANACFWFGKFPENIKNTYFIFILFAFQFLNLTWYMFVGFIQIIC